jgi:hypothetical protein
MRRPSLSVSRARFVTAGAIDQKLCTCLGPHRLVWSDVWYLNTLYVNGNYTPNSGAVAVVMSVSGYRNWSILTKCKKNNFLKLPFSHFFHVAPGEHMVPGTFHFISCSINWSSEVLLGLFIFFCICWLSVMHITAVGHHWGHVIPTLAKMLARFSKIKDIKLNWLSDIAF